MCDKELLVAYVYDDIIDLDRARFERHLRECATCRADVAAMRSVRDDLLTWDTPEPTLGFRLVQDRKPSWRAWWTPALGLAAAAVLVLGPRVCDCPGGGRLWSERPDGSNRLGARGRQTAAVARTPTDINLPQPAAQPVSVDAATLAALNRRLTQLEASVHTAGVLQASTTEARSSDAQIMRRVVDLLSQSEGRQQQELALRITQLNRDVDAQRVADPCASSRVRAVSRR